MVSSPPGNENDDTLPSAPAVVLPTITAPAARKAMLATFGNVAQASETVAAIIANRIVPATLEFLDNFTIRAVEDYSQAGLPVTAAALLLIEVDGHPAVVAEEAEKVSAICRQHGATEVHAANSAGGTSFGGGARPAVNTSRAAAGSWAY